MAKHAPGVERVVVVGAGTMGHGIAQVMATAGLGTTLVDVDDERLAAAVGHIETNLDKGVKLGKLTQAERDAALRRLATSTDLAGAAASVDLAVEAVPERMELKRDVFRTLDASAPERAILATNTSGLSVSQISAETKRPSQVAGMHFFNPVHIMGLVEIVRGDQTSEDCVETLRAISKRLGKTPIVVKDSPGFATSRLGIILGNEAIRMLEQGVASAKDIDTAMELGYRHPMGPLRLSDLVGLDVRLEISEYLQRELEDPRYGPPELLRTLVAEGKLGRKTGEGFYRYDS